MVKKKRTTAEMDELRERVERIEGMQNDLAEELWPGILRMASVQANAELLCDLLGNPTAKRLIAGRIAALRERAAERGDRFDEFNWSANVVAALRYSLELGAEKDAELAAGALRRVYLGTDEQEPIHEPE